MFIRVGTTDVQVTDNNGVSISGLWHVNPDGTPNGPGYTTPSGFFEGPVVPYTWDPIYKDKDYSIGSDISNFAYGDFFNDAVGDIFDVTLRNWGPCNPYDGGRSIYLSSGCS